MYEGFLPTTKKEMDELGIEQFDFIYITGDAYVDHPSFGAAIVTRLIESMGFTVGIISQPDWHTDRDFRRFGAPKYAFFVTAGNIDSMVAHYTAAKRKRSDDAYTAGGVAGKRPDRAVIVYCQKLREYFGDVPIAIGGLEASLRRFAHYDYWDDAVRPSVLLDSGADLLMYGMGEHQVQELCTRLANGENIRDIHDIRGTCYLTEPVNTPIGAAQCPSFEQVRDNKVEYAKAVKIQYDWQDEVYGKTIIQRHGKLMLVQLPPAYSLTTEELDHIYSFPYTRAIHPSYEALGGVPGIEEVRFSITHNRGCFGYCNFCSIALHQGRRITVRSVESVLAEAERITKMPDFKGYIHDVGGPTADFRRPSCDKQLTKGLCMGKKCLAPNPCPALKVDHTEYLSMLRRIRKVKGVKKVFIRSGIRYDYLIEDKDDEFMKELIMHHVSGQLKVAPEHISDTVLKTLGKPENSVYRSFCRKYAAINKKLGKPQYLVPYLMSSHPGSTLKEAIELAEYLRDNHLSPEQVQDFYPTPSTISTCMYYTGVDPRTMKPVFVEHDPHRKAMQRALIQYKNPNNYELVHEALELAHRTDLIGFDKKCLIHPRNKKDANTANKKTGRQMTDAELKFGISFEKYDRIQGVSSEKEKQKRPSKRKNKK